MPINGRSAQQESSHISQPPFGTFDNTSKQTNAAALVTSAAQLEKIIAPKPANGILVYNDDRVSPEERKAALHTYNYRVPLVIPTLGVA